jgi:hypothetical protein
MTTELMSSKNPDFQVLIHCPATGEQVLGNNLIHFSILDRKGVWWFCPACQGWHIMICGEDKKINLESYNITGTKQNHLILSH